MEIGFPEAIKLNVADWSHFQELDYEQLPFKCRLCHEYGHFARNCKKKSDEVVEKAIPNQWIQSQKAGSSKLKYKDGNVGYGTKPVGNKSAEVGFSKLVKNIEGYVGNGTHPEVNSVIPQAVGKVSKTSNSFGVLSSPEAQVSPVLEEGELQHSDVLFEEGEVWT